jgi:hypothetical protein
MDGSISICITVVDGWVAEYKVDRWVDNLDWWTNRQI